MIIWLKDIKGRWHRIKCASYEFIRGTYIFADSEGQTIAQYYESNIIGFRVKRKSGE